MQSFIALLRTRVGLAVLGIVLLGGLGAYFGATNVWHPDGLTGGNIANTGTSATATSAADSATASPSEAPTSAPTTPPHPTGQTVDLHGDIGPIGTNSFPLKTNGSTTTVIVNKQTRYEGAAPTLQDLQEGWSVEVKGQWQSDGTFLAILVNSHVDN